MNDKGKSNSKFNPTKERLKNYFVFHLFDYSQFYSFIKEEVGRD